MILNVPLITTHITYICYIQVYVFSFGYGRPVLKNMQGSSEIAGWTKQTLYKNYFIMQYKYIAAICIHPYIVNCHIIDKRKIPMLVK